jgi:hypothetical protein
VNKSAILSADGIYRYRLTREWDHLLPPLGWIMLNPSTADASVDDPTIRKCIKFARTWGYGRIEVVNLFAFRATNPKELRFTLDPIGPDNDDHIKQMVSEALDVVCAWGTQRLLYHRAPQVMQLLRMQGIKPVALRIAKGGEPWHPLYVPDNTKPVSYSL